MSAAKEWEFELLKTGYLRGLLGLPLAKDDVGLTREELITKYEGEIPKQT